MNPLKLSRFLLILILPVLIFLVSVNLAAFDNSFYSKKFREYGITNKIPDAEALNAKVMGFITGESNAISKVFNERERQHLADVRNLARNSNIAIYILVVLFVLLLVLFGLLLREESHIAGLIGKTLVYGGVFAIAAAIVLLLLALFNFNYAFDSFHKIFFQQGTYSFNPENELIVRLYPEQIFRDLGIKIIKTIFLISSIAIILGFILLSAFKKQKGYHWRS